ncbi:MAG: hypothetical protein JWM85_1232 [Acidimicrobiaceae bacterium]|nr:hypothetical protein [Acidimicrobiaceae bacterium]
MTTSPYSPWPETAYALSLLKPSNYPAHQAVLGIFVAHAIAQGVNGHGLVECSFRDLASHMHGGKSSSAAGKLLGAMTERHVLRRVDGGGSGTAPSLWGVWHWSTWKLVEWRAAAREAAEERIAFFGALSMRALTESGETADLASDRLVRVRALTKSARGVSADFHRLARESIEARARAAEEAVDDGLARAPMKARAGAGPSPLSLFGETPSLPGGGWEGEQHRSDKARRLIAALEAGCGTGHRVFPRSKLDADLRYFADESNGGFEELLRVARDPLGPRSLQSRVDLVRELFLKLSAAHEAPAPAAPAPPPAPPTAEELKRRDAETHLSLVRGRLGFAKLQLERGRASAEDVAQAEELVARAEHQLGTLVACHEETV